MHILATGSEFREITTARLGERAHATPAFVDGSIFIRTQQNLYRIRANGGSAGRGAGRGGGPGGADPGAGDRPAPPAPRGVNGGEFTF